MTRRLLLILMPCLLAGAMSRAEVAGTGVLPPRTPEIRVERAATWLTFPASAAADTCERELGAVVALPRDVRTATAVLAGGHAAAVSIAGDIMRQRGQPVVAIRVVEPGCGPLTIAVHHDGDWLAKTGERHLSPALQAGLPGLPPAAPAPAKSGAAALGGSYVIISAPQYAQTAAPLAAWKTRKGWPVVSVTTDETGTTGAAIRSWLQQAYDTWERPVEYLLLVGDVQDIPTYFVDGNVSDLPYALLDGADWLPDIMVGRFAVDNATQCAAMVAKSVHYEREPYLDQSHWFTRGVMIGGQYGSTTPMYTVRFCGEQLARIGFSPLVPVHPLQLQGNYIVSPYIAAEQIGVPQNLGPQVITPSINEGCSFVVYRGWAYGTGGWFSPTYQVANVQTLANGAMLPVVMSFVCHTGNFNADTPCMGEVFTRLGGSQPAEFRGAVAFFGNGEPWSRTRYNDAMAISVFECVTFPELTTLGALFNAGKLRFMEFFPGSLTETGDGFSVEFYFHIYNLLGDPELNYHRARPTPLAVTHAAGLPIGATLLDVAVAEQDGGAPLAGARVGVVQGGLLRGAAVTAADGSARVVLQSAIGAGPVDLTVTHPGRLAYAAVLNGAPTEIFLALDELLVIGQGGVANAVHPGASLSVLPTLRNLGSSASGDAIVALHAAGPVEVTAGSAALAPLAAGASASPDAPFALAVAAAAPDGAVISAYLDAQHDSQNDRSGFELRVQAPEISVLAATPPAGGAIEPGTTVDLTVTVANAGSSPTAGGTLAFSLGAATGAALLTESLPFGALAAHGGQLTAGPITLRLDAALAGGTTLNVAVTATCDEGAVQSTSFPLAIGRGDVTEPSGPCAYGYYAYDSADVLYPDQRPTYRWREISTALGGSGTRLPLDVNNYNRNVIVELPFAFTFYGQTFDRVRVADNGWLSFDADNDFYDFYNWPIPLALGNAALVAPFWDNLTPEPVTENPADDPVGLNSDGVYWYYDQPAGEVIFEWSRMRHIYAEVPELQTFQAVLRDPAIHAAPPTGDGEILFFYKQVADNDHLRMYATVGIESPDEATGLELTYDGVRLRGFAPPGPGMAVRLTTAPPVRVPLTVGAFTREQIAGAAHLAWTLTDPRPVVGWRIFALGSSGRIPLTAEALPAEARRCVVQAEPDQELLLEAVLPYGGTCDAGKAAAGALDLRFALADPMPNPVRSDANVMFALPRAGAAQLRVFDVRGRRVATLLDGAAAAGSHLIVWQGRDDHDRQLAAGIYFLRLEQAGRALTRKILLVR